MKITHIVSLIILLIVALWVASAWIFPPQRSTEITEKTDASENDVLATILRVEQRNAQLHSGVIRIYGQTEPNRSVEVAAETQGKVVSIPAKEGDRLKKGDIIVKIDPQDRPQQLARAKALLSQRDIEYKAALKLQKKGFQSEVRLAETKARLAEARANLKTAELDLSNTNVRAPFDGTLDRLHAEIGGFVGIGVFGAEGALALFLDHDPLVVTGQVSEKDRSGIAMDATAQIRLNTGEEVEGKVRYISTVADSESRTFRIEVEVENKDHTLPSGVTAELRIESDEQEAYFISPSLLALDDKGTVGVKYVDDENTVRFAAIEVLDDSEKGMWVAGLPSSVNMIVSGQNYVSTGQVLEAELFEKADNAELN